MRLNTGTKVPAYYHCVPLGRKRPQTFIYTPRVRGHCDSGPR